jgi:hypothetical protein
MLPVVLALFSTACVSAGGVERTYDGHVVMGRSVEAAAYAAYVRGFLAELDGRREEGIAAYREVLRMDPVSAEAAARLQALACSRGSSDPPASKQGTHLRSTALARDPKQASAKIESDRCAAPVSSSAGSELARGDTEDRTRIVARGVASDQPADGWGAVAGWAEARRDVALDAYAQARMVRLSGPWRGRAIATALRFAGQGELGAARILAAAIVDARGDPLAGGDGERIGRLAVDEAIATGDVALARSRATQTRIGLEEAAARALLANRPEVASALGWERVRAEPESLGGRLVVASVEGGDLLGVLDDRTAASEPVSAAAYVAYALALLRENPPPEVRAVLGRIPHADPSSGDDLVVRAATELAALGVVTEGNAPVRRAPGVPLARVPSTLCGP